MSAMRKLVTRPRPSAPRPDLGALQGRAGRTKVQRQEFGLAPLRAGPLQLRKRHVDRFEYPILIWGDFYS